MVTPVAKSYSTVGILDVAMILRIPPVVLLRCPGQLCHFKFFCRKVQVILSVARFVHLMFQNFAHSLVSSTLQTVAVISADCKF